MQSGGGSKPSVCVCVCVVYVSDLTHNGRDWILGDKSRLDGRFSGREQAGVNQPTSSAVCTLGETIIVITLVEHK